MSSMLERLWPVFVAEMGDQLDRLEKTLACAPEDVDLQETFREFHTLKSSCSMVDFGSLEHVAHACEDMLSEVRKEDGAVLVGNMQALLVESVDWLRQQWSKFSDSREKPAANPELLERIHAEIGQRPAATAQNAHSIESASPSPSPVVDENLGTLRVSGDMLDKLVSDVGHLAMHENALDHYINATGLDARLGELESLLAKILQGNSDTDNLHQAISHIDELSLHRGRIAELDQRVQTSLARAQQDVLELRVIPIGIVFNRLPQLVMKTADDAGKKVQLEIVGSEVRIDKGMVDVLMEPLVHIIRNAIDHGIEKSEDRITLGKPPQGVVRVHAEHFGNRLRLDVSDDGRGLDPKRIMAKARNLGLYTSADEPDTDEIYQFIFLPGFTTADVITETSGRGVGMDVVKTRVAALGGTLEVLSRPGIGTSFRFYLPLSAAIQQVMLVTCHQDIIALPARSVTEITTVDAGLLQEISGQSAIMFRDEILPVYSLEVLLGWPVLPLHGEDIREVLILNGENGCIGLMVGQVVGRQELFVRDLDRHLRNMPAISGMSLLGDGSVVLILNAEDVYNLALKNGHVIDNAYA